MNFEAIYNNHNDRIIFLQIHDWSDVVYKPMYGDRQTWIRPLAMFDETIERDGRQLKRFEFVR